jgi:hypothetical protein
MMTDHRQVTNWRSSLFLFAGFSGVALAALAVGFGWITTEQGWLILAASGISLAASQLDRITEISAGGASAKLQEKIQEADEAVEHVRALATTLAQPTMKMAVRLGRWGSHLSKRETYDFKLKIETALRKLGASQDEIAAAVHDYYRHTLFDLTFQFMPTIKSALDAKVNEFHKRTQGFVAPISEVDPMVRTTGSGFLVGSAAVPSSQRH